MNPILTTAEAAQLLHCSEYTIEEHARQGTLPGLKFGREWVFPATALLAHLGNAALTEAEKRRAPVPHTRARVAPKPPLKIGEKPDAIYAAAQKFGIDWPPTRAVNQVA